MFVLRLLGGVSLEGPDGPLSGPSTQRHRLALLALLCLAPNRTLGREKLLAYLWPESGTERARRSLNVSVHALRRALGEDAILSVGETLRLDPGRVQCDACRFGEAVERGELRTAEALYTGPFLDGFFLDDAAEFERWAAAQRDRLAALHASALERMAEEAEASGDRRQAVARWKRVAAHDLYSSRVAVRLMQALADAGDRAGALQHAQLHSTLLREDLGAEPDPQLVALAEQLRCAQEPARPPAEPSEARGAGDGPVTAGTPAAAGTPAPACDDPAPAPPPASRPRSGRFTPSRIAAATLALAALAVALWTGWPERAALPPSATSIAVLPFSDDSGNGDNEYFVDGLTEEIIHSLSRVEGLHTISRTSSFAFKGRPADAREIGEQLRVEHLLEGGVRRYGDDIRITIRLIRASTGSRLWSAEYTEKAEDILLLQDRVARAVVDSLRVGLVGASPLARDARHASNVEALDLYFKGRHSWYRRTPSSLVEAASLFREATRRDPDYALAYTGVADVYNMLGAYDYSVLAPDSAFPRARAASERALAIDPEAAEAYAARAVTLMNYEWDWPGAEAAFRRAIDLNPGYAPAHHWYSLFLVARGRTEEAFAEVLRARELDPLSVVTTTALGRYYYFVRRYERAEAEYRRALEMDSTFATAHLGLGLVLAQTGALAEAVAEFERAHALVGDHPIALGLLGYAHALQGDRAAADGILQRLTAASRAGRVYVPPEALLLVHLGSSDHDRALDWLERAFRNRSGSMTYLAVEPALDPLREHPRFQRLVERVESPGARSRR